MFHANFMKKQTYLPTFANVLISFWLKHKNNFMANQLIYSLFHIENLYRTGCPNVILVFYVQDIIMKM